MAITQVTFDKKLWLSQILIGSSKYKVEARFTNDRQETLVRPGVLPCDSEILDALKTLFNFVNNPGWSPNKWDEIDEAFDTCGSENYTYYVIDKSRQGLKFWATRKDIVLAVVSLMVTANRTLKDDNASIEEIAFLISYDWGRLLLSKKATTSKLDYSDQIKEFLKQERAKKAISAEVSNKSDDNLSTKLSDVDPSDALDTSGISPEKYDRTRGIWSGTQKSPSRTKRKDRERDLNKVPGSSKVRGLIGTPGSKSVMTGENGFIFSIEQKSESTTSSKTPMALIMPYSDKSNSRRVNNINGVEKNKVRVSASISSPETFVLYFNTKKEAEDMIDKIKATSTVQHRIAPGVNINDLTVVAINILAKDPYMSQREWDKFSHLFYQVDTDLGPAYILAAHLNESLDNETDDDQLNETAENAENIKPKESYYHDFDTYEEAFLSELN